MSEPLKIAVAGALGRMGQAVAKLAGETGVTVVGRFDRPGAEGEGLSTLEEGVALAQVVVDFTTPAASAALAEHCAAEGRPALVIGSTGWSEAEEARVATAARRVAIVKAGNFSLGLNMLMGLVEQAARALPAEAWDIEVSETHHRRKVDAPSGTALMLGEAAAAGREVGLAQVAVRGRDGLTGPRPDGAIGFVALRGGGVIGEHSVMFAAEDEIVTFSHSARDRTLFARGALAAAAWVADKPPGLYDMRDVLGFSRKE